MLGCGNEKHTSVWMKPCEKNWVNGIVCRLCSQNVQVVLIECRTGVEETRPLRLNLSAIFVFRGFFLYLIMTHGIFSLLSMTKVLYKYLHSIQRKLRKKKSAFGVKFQIKNCLYAVSVSLWYGPWHALCATLYKHLIFIQKSSFNLFKLYLVCKHMFLPSYEKFVSTTFEVKYLKNEKVLIKLF